MFWKKTASTTEIPKPKSGKLPGPQGIPALVAKTLTTKLKMNADLVPILKAVVRKRSNGDKAFDVRIFDESEAAAMQLTVKDYLTLEQNSELIIYDGWYDEASKQVSLEQKKKMPETKLFTEAEIRQKIEALSEPGSTVLFYQAQGTQMGGPLGKGAAIIELNPNYPDKGKKFNIYAVDVIGLEPKAKQKKFWDTSNIKAIVRWIKESHHKRLY